MHALESNMVVSVNDSCSLAKLDGLRVTARVELWDPSAILFFTAVCMDGLYHVRHLIVTVGDREPLHLDIDAHVGDTDTCDRYSSARRRVRVASRLESCTHDNADISVQVVATKVCDGSSTTKTKSAFEARMRPVASLDSCITPFGRRSLPVPF